eukprot:Rmarinus@m.7462
MIGLWLFGDCAKTIYFLATGAPLQFAACGLFQMAVDSAIVFQFFAYAGHSESWDVVDSKTGHSNPIQILPRDSIQDTSHKSVALESIGGDVPEGTVKYRS